DNFSPVLFVCFISLGFYINLTLIKPIAGIMDGHKYLKMYHPLFFITIEKNLYATYCCPL
ncbi:hypothetical protein J1782_23175, partial [Rahnella sp. BCC 1045]|uniref:hypothetical protein n=1 Tax=Rahnella sp. BCC 1045 TaxID=2816251 RepID=UPI001C25A585